MIHATAIVGSVPQMRTWYPGMPFYPPEIGEGVFIGALTCVDSGFERPTVIGANTWLMKQTHIGHDCIIGEDCEIATGTVLAGYVEIGDRTKLGLNVTVLPFVKIGRDCVIGAGAVVTKDVPDLEQWVGNPARPVKRKLQTTIARKWVEHHTNGSTDV